MEEILNHIIALVVGALIIVLTLGAYLCISTGIEEATEGQTKEMVRDITKSGVTAILFLAPGVVDVLLIVLLILSRTISYGTI